MADKARHAFGSEANIATALEAGKIDAFDILFLDEKKVGWINKSGEVVIAEGEEYVKPVGQLPTDDGKANVIYIFENSAYIWNGTKCVPISQSADLTALEEKVALKVDETTMQEKINESATETIDTAKAYTDTKFADVTSAIEIIEF